MNSQTYVECLLKDFHILFPNATLKKRCVALEIALFRKENKTTTPPTKLYMP